MLVPSDLSLYAIHCIRKIFQVYHYKQIEVLQLLDRARLTEATDDMAVWSRSSEVKKDNISLQTVFVTFILD